jgi:enoyl-CoA hydratase/carnithine racemase
MNEILVHCDFVYAGESAPFSTPFVDLAVVPEMGSSYGLPGLVGRRWAAEMLLLGTRIDAARAAQIGLVTAVVPDAVLLETAMEAAQKLAAKPPHALTASKKLVKQELRERLDEAGRLEAREFAVRVRSPEAKAAFDAFFQKRR